MSSSAGPSPTTEGAANIAAHGGVGPAHYQVTSSSSSSNSTVGVVKGAPSHYVKLNVGGCLFHTTVATLTKHDNMLRAMFSGRMEVLTDAEGWIMIDRCGKHFGTILNFLRDGSVPLPENKRELSELQAEAKYYCAEELVLAVEKALRSFRDREDDGAVTPICRVPLLTSKREEQALIAANHKKPTVKLLVNRHNNKYSYTGASDDMILKNVELFDRLSLRFSPRFLFLKDTISSSDVCLWSFYGHGKRVSEVSCSAIVYATDRKNTKVDCPEARIYEECLNLMLYEDANGPDLELLHATSSRAHVTRRRSCNLDPTSDEEEDRHHRGGVATPTEERGAHGGGGGGNNGGGGGHHHHGGGGHQQQQQQQPRASGLSRLRSSKNHN